MHGSRFLTDANLALLTDTMLTAIGENCPLAVRTLTQLTMLQKALGAKKGRRLMLFDDGISVPKRIWAPMKTEKLPFLSWKRKWKENLWEERR